MKQYQGLLVIDKPTGMTSRAVLDRCKGWFPRKTKLGHTGTLDPLATGVLVVCIGNVTRLADYVQKMGKTYRAGVMLGGRSDTDDAQGRITPGEVIEPPSRARMQAELGKFLGVIDQVPPDYSAAHVTGQRAYDLARRGKPVQLEAKPVRIDAIDLESYQYPRLDLRVDCGKGTYIRSLARDLGDRLGCGAYLQSLRRTRIGPFSVENAITLDHHRAEAFQAILPIELAVGELPRVEVTAEEIIALGHGLVLPREGITRDEEVAIFGPAGNFFAIGTLEMERCVLRPDKVFRSDEI